MATKTQPQKKTHRAFFFVHLLKTGGTSFIARVARHYSDAAVYPSQQARSHQSLTQAAKTVISVDHLVDQWRRHAETIRLISGHFPLCTTELLGNNFTTLTVLREPVTRTLSYLRHHRQVIPGSGHLTLEEVYDDPERFHGLIHNHMVKMLSLTTQEMAQGALTRVQFTQERLEKAKENLARIDLMGLQEYFDEFCNESTRRYGWNLGKPIRTNKTAVVDIPDELRERIMQDNWMDIELYNYARKLYMQRIQKNNATSSDARVLNDGSLK